MKDLCITQSSKIHKRLHRGEQYERLTLAQKKISKKEDRPKRLIPVERNGFQRKNTTSFQ